MRREFQIAFLILLGMVAILAFETAAQQMSLHGHIRLFPVKFADLKMADKTKDGAITYCADCAAPASPGVVCKAGGKGAEAHRIRGEWVCF